jgi:hypothetical protein
MNGATVTIGLLKIEMLKTNPHRYKLVVQKEYVMRMKNQKRRRGMSL